MKIRNGFVSNSSSSSFLIYGISGSSFSFTEEGKRILLEYYVDEYPREDDESDEEYLERLVEEVENDDGWYEIMERFSIPTISVDHPPYDDYYIGASWDEVLDDETGAQFKCRIRESIKKYLDVTDEEFGTFSEAWFDG